ncbi:hypothetical protein ETAA8_23120 [Anatilimnocola aggregata]|uniref:Uncharacterized protein n=1 Tax=Anatilimnocola aggregata TaxID=2528021 RepID=A0A517YAF8_9BACT|nr:hypothetical protein [Anatilimnocola aggregata]QDU27226.1 hypothetical protein ETAA8_23120 [Anatilimnocola aggregata]
MLRLHRSALYYVRPLLRAALELTPSKSDTPVTFVPTVAGLLVRAQNENVAIEFTVEGAGSGAPISVPYGSLAKVEGRQHEPLELAATLEGNVFRWSEVGIPQVLSAPALEPAAWPSLPAQDCANDAELLTALREAAATTDIASLRYSLGCIRFRGDGGQLAATDGRQAILLSGFRFPWSGDVLARRCPVFTKLRLAATDERHVGRTEDWLVFRAPRWTLWLKIKHEARFPDVESQIPAREQADTTLSLAEADATFILQKLKHLPGGADQNEPITIDLNGSVAVRAKNDSSSVTELVLSSSERSGAQVRCCSDRRYLQRAVQLGFREILFRGTAAPLFCRDTRRAYVWALLSAEHCLKHNEQATRIASPRAATAVQWANSESNSGS